VLCYENRRTSKNGRVTQVLPMHAYTRLTFNVPSSVHATITRSSTSLARPMIERSFFLVPNPRLTTSGGGGPMLNDLRFIPDCMFHMWIIPVEDPKVSTCADTNSLAGKSQKTIIRSIQVDRIAEEAHFDGPRFTLVCCTKGPPTHFFV